MKSSIILASALATLAMAKVKTDVVYVTKTITATGVGPSPTAAAPETTADAAQFYSAPEDNAPETSAPAQQADPAPAATPDYSGLSDYAAPILQAHNKARAEHGVGALEWDDNLASIAKLIGQTCIYEHNTQMSGGGYGQNIAAGAGPGDINGVIYNDMYQSEIANYNSYGSEPNMGDLGSWGHATQIIWKSSTKVGCATVQCNVLAQAAGMAPEFTVCNYEPAGNMIGAFAENVLQ